MTIQTTIARALPAPDAPRAKPRFNGMQFARTAHKKAARVLGYALTLGDFSAWQDAGRIWTAHLGEAERAALAYTALRTLTPQNAQAVAAAVVGGSAGRPVATSADHLNDAALWAELSAPDELEAYCFACFDALPETRQAAFLEFAKRRLSA